jgi:ABC-2 type transport system ATP-binding protein
VSEALEFRDVGKRFDQTWVIDHLDFTVGEGSVLGLIGPSGSGKTTIIRLANGVYRPDKGEVRLLGADPTRMRASQRSRIGYLPQTPVLFDDLTLLQNLNFHASLNGLRLRRRAWLDEVLALVELDGDETKLVREASGGMKRRLALAATLVHSPPILVLDEPTAGLDPILRQRLWDEFRRLADAGHTLIISTQYVGEAAYCRMVGLLAEGRMIAHGSPEDLRRKACGGEMLEIEIDRPIAAEAITAMEEQVGATRSELRGPNRLRLVVDDAGAATAPLLEFVERHGVRTVDTEEIIMSYDDMFVALVERARSETQSARTGETVA